MSATAPFDPAQGQPTDESSTQILNDSLNLIASTTLAGASYGIMLTVAALCVYGMLQAIQRSTRTRTSLYFVYISVLIILSTLYTASASRMVNLAYVDHRDYPGGPSVYAALLYSDPINVMGNISFTITTWLVDGLIVSPCIVLAVLC